MFAIRLQYSDKSVRYVSVDGHELVEPTAPVVGRWTQTDASLIIRSLDIDEDEVDSISMINGYVPLV